TVVITEVTDSDIDPESIARNAESKPSAIVDASTSGPSTVVSSKLESSGSRAHTASAPWLTARVILFLFVFLLVVGAVIVMTTSYVNRSYFVGLKGENVAIFKGHPGGQFGIEPKLVIKEPLLLSDIPPARQNDVKNGKIFQSRESAEKYVDNLVSEAN